MSGWNLLLLCLLAAGHAELWITLVNRIHSLPVHHRKLQRIRHIHDVMIVGIPLVLVWALGLSGPRLLLGGSWEDVPAGWYPLLIASSLGVLGGLYGVVRFQRSRRCPALISQQATVTTLAAADGTLPLASGQFERLARLPFNEQFEVEFNRKCFRMPGLAPTFSGLKILHISDWHFEGTITREFFERASEIASREAVDLVAFTGDLLDNDRCVEWFPTTLGRFSAPLGCWYILGNHDWYLDSFATRRELSALGWKDASSGVQTLDWNGGQIVIAGDETPWMGTAPVFSTGDLAAQAATPQLRILLSHTPDHLPRARQQGVDLMLSGHNHGGQVQLPLIGPVFSPSRFGCRYAGGAFWEPPTLLHVSRGLSGRHPLRWRCRPEMTVIELVTDRSPGRDFLPPIKKHAPQFPAGRV